LERPANEPLHFHLMLSAQLRVSLTGHDETMFIALNNWKTSD
jgi:hypothetical protein